MTAVSLSIEIKIRLPYLEQLRFSKVAKIALIVLAKRFINASYGNK